MQKNRKKLAIALLLSIMLTGCGQGHEQHLYHITVIDNNSDVVAEYQEAKCQNLDTGVYRIVTPDGKTVIVSGGIVIIEEE